MEHKTIVVSYFSANWIRVLVESYLEHFPEERMLVVDNNPRRSEEGWQPACEVERNWLACHPGVELIDNDAAPIVARPYRTHGAGMDAALAWCRNKGVRVMVHLEPDCLITGREWRDNLMAALDTGAWMAGCHRQDFGPIHPMPSAWLVQDVRASFQARQWRVPDEPHPRFKDLVDLEALRRTYEPIGLWGHWGKHWDTGHKAWFEAAIHNRAALVDGHGCHHFWNGSTARRWSEAEMTARYPHFLPYFERSRSRMPPRSVYECPYREDVNDDETSEFAHCQLLSELSGVDDKSWCVVARDACQACSESLPPTLDEPNPVVAALLHQLANRILLVGGVSGCCPVKSADLLAKAEKNLEVKWQ